MTWNTRRQRLQQLSTKNPICFQLYVGVIKEITSEDEFDEIAKQRGVDMELKEFAELSARSVIEEAFPLDWLQNAEGIKEGCFIETEALLTISPYPNKNINWRASNPIASAAEND